MKQKSRTTKSRLMQDWGFTTQISLKSLNLRKEKWTFLNREFTVFFFVIRKWFTINNILL